MLCSPISARSIVYWQIIFARLTIASKRFFTITCRTLR
jgi:hypothetical protein